MATIELRIDISGDLESAYLAAKDIVKIVEDMEAVEDVHVLVGVADD